VLKIQNSQTIYPQRARTTNKVSGLMRKSKLEACEEIMGVLMKEASTVDRIAYQTSMDCNNARQHVHFMIKNGLIDERKLGGKTLYAVTERGVAVLRALNFQKYLEKVKNKISTIHEAMEIIPVVSEQDQTLQNRE
jgi:predicted transcriptional regulator